MESTACPPVPPLSSTSPLTHSTTAPSNSQTFFTGSQDRGIAKTVGEGSAIHFSPDPEMPILHHFEDSPILGVSDVQKSPPIKGAAKMMYQTLQRRQKVR